MFLFNTHFIYNKYKMKKYGIKVSNE
jgi:hypothetical protein